jgi:hypothetical protein
VSPAHPVVDHLAYLHDRHHRRATHAAFRRAAKRPPGSMSRITVRHETDGSCCEMEPWGVTAGRIMAALAEDGDRTAWVVPIRGAS